MQAKNYSLFTKSQENFLDLRLYQFGKERCEPLHMYGPVKRNHYLFHFILSGLGVLQYTSTDNEVHGIELHQNQGFLIFPGQVNTYFADETYPWEYAWVEFDGIQVQEFTAQCGLSQDQPLYEIQDNQSAASLHQLFLNFIQYGEQSDYRLISNLYETLDQMITLSAHKPRPTTTTKLRDPYVEQAVVYIKRHYARSLTVAEIADACGLDKSYLGRIFKREFSTSIQRFIIEYRLSKACLLLENSDSLVKYISPGLFIEFQKSSAIPRFTRDCAALVFHPLGAPMC